MCFVGLSVYWIWSDLSKRNLAVRQSTGMEKKASDWGEWMSTVITCTRVKVKIKVKVKVKEKRQGQGQGEEGLRLWRVDVHSDHLHQG